MNNGAFGENFPYSNFHDLNMDWIIKIARDFLDQYTNIQNTISTGLDDLDTKATELQELLDAWYTEHSEDIARQLADALEAMDQALTEKTAQFNSDADTKTAESLASIPDDYTALSNKVADLEKGVSGTYPKTPKWNYGYVDTDGVVHEFSYDNPNRYTDLFYLDIGFRITKTGYAKNLNIYRYQQNGTFIARDNIIDYTSATGFFNIIIPGYYRLSLELNTEDATETFNPNNYITIEKKLSIIHVEDALNKIQQIIPMAWQNGYINGSGAEMMNNIDARTVVPVKIPKGSRLVSNGVESNAIFIHIYSSNGTWLQLNNLNEFKTRYGEPTTQDVYVRVVAQRATGMTPQYLTLLNSEAPSFYCYFVNTAYYSLLYDLENNDTFIKDKLIIPTYSKTDVVQSQGAPVCFPVHLEHGHRYKFYFKSSEPLYQTNFYLQIWESEITDVSEGGVVVKNWVNVWGTQDTSAGLEFLFDADADYDGYFRFGYYATPVSSGIIVWQQIYDLTEPTYGSLLKSNDEYTTIGINDAYWKGRKIVWFGTSIPAGVIGAGDTNGQGAYPQRVGEMLGATVYNEAIGSSAARIGMHGSITSQDPNGYAGVPASCCLLALSGTRAEKQAILNNWNYWRTVFTQGVADVDPSNPDLYLNSSYETLLTKYLAGGSVGEVDLYVFDHGYNDGGNGNGSDYSDTTDVPYDPLDRTYFIGAMNFLINKIKESNYKAKVIIISHYNDENAYADLVEAQSYVANKWNIPFINISNKLGFTSSVAVTINGTTKTMKNWWMPDNVHPASDTTGDALKHYADILYPMIRDIR